MVARNSYDDPFDDAFDANGILRDGKTMTVGMLMRDSMTPLRRAVAEEAARGYGLINAARHQPGPCFCTDQVANGARAQAYQDAKRELEGAWKKNSMSDREVARVHDTGDPVRDAYLDQVYDLTTAWSRRR